MEFSSLDHWMSHDPPADRVLPLQDGVSGATRSSRLAACTAWVIRRSSGGAFLFGRFEVRQQPSVSVCVLESRAVDASERRANR